MIGGNQTRRSRYRRTRLNYYFLQKIEKKKKENCPSWLRDSLSLSSHVAVQTPFTHENLSLFLFLLPCKRPKPIIHGGPCTFLPSFSSIPHPLQPHHLLLPIPPQTLAPHHHQNHQTPHHLRHGHKEEGEQVRRELEEGVVRTGDILRGQRGGRVRRVQEAGEEEGAQQRGEGGASVEGGGAGADALLHREARSVLQGRGARLAQLA